MKLENQVVRALVVVLSVAGLVVPNAAAQPGRSPAKPSTSTAPTTPGAGKAPPPVTSPGPTGAFPKTVKVCQHNDTRKACSSSPGNGSLGTGPAFSFKSRMTKFQGALIEGSTLYIGFGEKSVYRTNATAIYAVDLATGNRKVISGGFVSNPNDEYSAQKVQTVGSGVAFGIISTVRRSKPGKLFVSSYNGPFIVDEATGARDKITIDESAGCGKNVGAADLTAEGNLAMAFENRDSSGISIFDMQTKRCRIASSHTDNKSAAVGSGPELPGSRFSNIVRSADDPNVFYAYHHSQTGVWSVNVTTGARRVVARRSGPEKRGDASDYLDGMPSTSPGRVWYASDEAAGVSTPSGNSGVMFLSTSTGNQTVFSANDGPSSDMTTVMLPVPSDPRWVVFTSPSRDGVALLDTQTSASIWLSY